MSYTSSAYLMAFLPITLLLYQLTPRIGRRVVLIAASYVFFFSLSKFLFIYLVAATTVTFFVALGMEKYENKKNMLKLLGIFALVGALIVFKYRAFIWENTALLLSNFGVEIAHHPGKLLVPIGISFYTLEAIGYMLDVYWGKKQAVRNYLDFMLFMGFFPKLMEGPISQIGDVDQNLFKYESLQFENLKLGMLRIFWGLFKKLVIADRLAIFVNSIYDNYTEYYGIMMVVAAVSYTVQLYMEFSGVMDICIGSAKLFGIILTENFRQPFFAKNATEFWQRWHISLGRWLKAYVFYPVSVSGLVKKWNKFARHKIGKFWTRVGTSAMALFPVWAINGLWHGPQWNYIFYGMYYFVILLVEVSVEQVWKKFVKEKNINVNAFWYRGGQLIKLLLIVFVGEMFFRADTLTIGMSMFGRIFTGGSWHFMTDGTLLSLGIDFLDMTVIIIGTLIVFLYDYQKEKNLITYEKFQTIALPARWSLYYALILSVIIFGAYGEGYQAIDLIYAGF